MKLNNKVANKPKKVNPKEMLKKSYADKIQDDLEKEGAVFFSPTESGGTLNIDKDYLTLPKNLTEVSTRDLGEYLNAFTQQKVYMRTLLGYAEMFLEDYKSQYYTASERIYKKFLGTKMTETSKEREVNSDPEVKPHLEKYTEYKNKVRLLTMNIDSITDILFLISREVSRRTGDFSEENRNYNVSRK